MFPKCRFVSEATEGANLSQCRYVLVPICPSADMSSIPGCTGSCKSNDHDHKSCENIL